MILPTKHLGVQESLLGSGAEVLKSLSRPQTVSRLWEKLRANPSTGSYNRFILTLAFLYSINAIEYSDGVLRRAAE